MNAHVFPLVTKCRGSLLIFSCLSRASKGYSKVPLREISCVGRSQAGFFFTCSWLSASLPLQFIVQSSFPQ